MKQDRLKPRFSIVVRCINALDVCGQDITADAHSRRSRKTESAQRDDWAAWAYSTISSSTVANECEHQWVLGLTICTTEHLRMTCRYSFRHHAAVKHYSYAALLSK